MIAQRGVESAIPPRKSAPVWSGYHRRSLVETYVHCFKRLGERVMACTFERQVVALHVRVALLNRALSRGRAWLQPPTPA